MRHLVLPSLLLTLLVPTASAHIAHPPSSEVVELGEYELAVTPVPAPVYENTSTTLILVDIAQNASTELPPMRVRFSDERGFLFERSVSRNGSFYETGAFSFNATGEIRSRIIMTSPESDHEADFAFNVYRRLPFSFAPIDATDDPVERKTYTLTFKTIDPGTTMPIDALADLHGIVVSASRVPPESPGDSFVEFAQNGTGTWSATYTFAKGGTWWIMLSSASGGFAPGETPPWQIDVLPAPDTKDTPSVGAAAIGMFVVAAAFAIRRR